MATKRSAKKSASRAGATAASVDGAAGETVDPTTRALTIPRSTFEALDACSLLDLFVNARGPKGKDTPALAEDAARASPDGGLTWPMGWSPKNLERTALFPRALGFLVKHKLVPVTPAEARAAILRANGLEPRTAHRRAFYGRMGPLAQMSPQ